MRIACRRSWSFYRHRLAALLTPSRRIQLRSVLPWLLFAVPLAVGFSILYVEQETPTWFWDYANYHQKFKELIPLLDDGIFPFIAAICDSVSDSQHNYTAVLPLFAGRLLFGPQRVAYIVSLVLFYLLPAGLLVTWLSRRAWGRSWQATSAPAVLLAAWLYTPFWAPTLRGHPDLVCIVPLTLASLLLLRCRYLLQGGPANAAGIGLLLWSSFLLRRHTLFTIAGLLVSTLLFALLLLASRRWHGRPIQLWPWLRNGFCLLLALVLPALLLQHGFVSEILNPAYASTFGAYRQDLADQLQEIFRFYGPVLLLSAALGGLLAALWRADGILFLLLVPPLALVGFQQAQAPSDQHLLVFSLFLFPAACAPFVLIGHLLRQRSRRWLNAVWLALPVSFHLHTFAVSPRLAAAVPAPLAWLAPGRTYPPLRLASYASVRSLSRQLRSLLEASRGEASIAVLASSDQLNIHILRAVSSRSLRSHLQSVSDVDLRDAFRLDLLDADYVVATDPASVHLGEQNQRVITIPSTALRQADNPFGAAYVRLAGLEHRLADGRVVSVYRRTRPRSEAEVQWLHAQLQRHYPTWRRTAESIGLSRGQL